MSSLGRMLAILDLFDGAHPMRSADEICEALHYSRPTGYRYVKELVAAGLLMRLGGSFYALGPRIILLDYHIRQTDPVLRAGVPIMRQLAEATGCDCVLSGLFGTQILDTHRETGIENLTLTYGRGRPRPLFQGAAPKVILASFPKPRLKKLYDGAPEAIRLAGLGDSWEAFRAYLAAVRKRGYYVSRGELEPQLSSVAAPIFGPEDDVVGSLALVVSTKRFAVLDEDIIVKLVCQAAERLTLMLSKLPGRGAAQDARPPAL